MIGAAERRTSGARRLAGAIAVAMALAACGSSAPQRDGGGGSAGSTETGGSGAGASGAEASGPLAYTTDDAAAVTSTVGPDGGSLEVTNAAGDRFVLDVPAGALLSEETISMVPTASIDDIGFDAAGVVFGPAGLHFVLPATLTVTAAAPLPAERGFAFTFSDDGQDVGAAEIATGADGFAIVVPHFSGYAFGAPESAARTAFLQRQASDAEIRLNGKMQELAAARQGEGAADFAGEMEALLEQWDEEVVQPRLAAAGASCAAAKEAIAAVLGAERQRQLLGDTSGAVDVPALVKQAYPVCEEEAIAQCRAANDPSILMAFWLGVNRIMQLHGEGDYAPSDPEEATRRCATGYAAEGGTNEAISGVIADLNAPFTLDGVIDGGTSVYSYSGGMTGTVTLEGSGSDATWNGEGTYTITDNGDGTLTMTHTNSWCLTSPVASCSTSTEVLTLTPLGG